MTKTSPLIRISDQIERAIDAMGRWLSWLTLAVVLVVFAVVLLRYVLDTGSLALQESALFMHSAVFMLGISFALKRDQHVRVDIVHQRLSVRGKAWADIAGTVLFLLPFCVFMFLISLDYVGASWAVHEGSRDAGGLPGVYLLKTLIPLAAFCLGLQGIALLLRQFRKLRTLAGSQTP